MTTDEPILLTLAPPEEQGCAGCENPAVFLHRKGCPYDPHPVAVEERRRLRGQCNHVIDGRSQTCDRCGISARELSQGRIVPPQGGTGIVGPKGQPRTFIVIDDRMYNPVCPVCRNPHCDNPGDHHRP